MAGDYRNLTVGETISYGAYYVSRNVNLLEKRTKTGLNVKALLLTGARQTGKSYQRHNALSNIMADQSYNIREALVLSGANVKVVDRIKYLPIYMLMFLEKDKPIDIFVKVDLPTL